MLPSLSAFISSTKKRNSFSEIYLQKRLRGLFNTTVINFEETIGEKPDTVFTSLFIMYAIAQNRQQVIILNDDGKKQYYLYGIRIVPTKINIIVAGICSSAETLKQDLHEINKHSYDLVKELDHEFDREYCIPEPVDGV